MKSYVHFKRSSFIDLTPSLLCFCTLDVGTNDGVEYSIV